MSIFAEYSGPLTERGFYSAADWDKLQNPSDWARTQEEYDAFVEEAQSRAENRKAALSRAQEAIPTSYAVEGYGGTNPYLSLSGFSGHTSGGTAGLSGFSGTGTPLGYAMTEFISPQDIPEPPRSDDGVVEFLEEGGVIESPYANPMRRSAPSMQSVGGGMNQFMPVSMPTSMAGSGDMRNMPMGVPDQAIGGLFRNLHKPAMAGQRMNPASGNGMEVPPLERYQHYLMKTYVHPHMTQQANKVEEFLSLVNQAERAHFGQNNTFGYQPPTGAQSPQMMAAGGIATLMG